MVLYPNKLPESERVCSGICKLDMQDGFNADLIKDKVLECINRFEQ